MKRTTNLVDDAITVVMSDGNTIARERQAVSYQLHAAESYPDFLQSALEALATGLANDEFWDALCTVITDAIFVGKKIEEMAAARNVIRKVGSAPSGMPVH